VAESVVAVSEGEVRALLALLLGLRIGTACGAMARMHPRWCTCTACHVASEARFRSVPLAEQHMLIAMFTIGLRGGDTD
jgi:hypothetical protein